MLGTAELEESNTFADIEEDEDELEENELGVEDCYFMNVTTLCLYYALLLYDAVHVV